MLNVREVWAEISQQPPFFGRKLTEFGIQDVVLRYDGLASGAVVQSQQVTFPNGAIILGIQGSAWIDAQTGSALLSSGLSLFALSLDYQQQRSIVGPNRACASDVFGAMGDKFPAKALKIPTNSSLLYSLENLSTSTIHITLSHHCLVPVNVG